MDGQSSRDSKLAIEAIRLKCNKYTMDPGRQIYLSGNKKTFWSKVIFEPKKFGTKNLKRKSFFQTFLVNVQKSFLTKNVYVFAEINLTSGVHCIVLF